MPKDEPGQRMAPTGRVLLLIVVWISRATPVAGLGWRVRFGPTTPVPLSSTTSIQLIDWREWKQMGPVGPEGPLMLIVDTKGEDDLPEAETADEEHVDKTDIVPTSTTTPTTTTTTTISTPTTTTISSEQATDSSTAKPSESPKDVTIELKNLPNVLNMLKHLSLIPAVVRSFAGATNPGPLFPGGSDIRYSPESSLRSRALTANTGYDAKAPSFVTAQAAESVDPSQAWLPSPPPRPPNPLVNMPAPIIPINRDQQRAPSQLTMDSRMQQLNRLNIYGIEPLPTTESKAYEAPTRAPPRQRPQFDLSNLTVSEVEQLESIHRKLFPNSTPTPPTLASLRVKPLSSTATPASLFIYNKPQQANMAETQQNLHRQLEDHFAHHELHEHLGQGHHLDLDDEPQTEDAGGPLTPEMVNELMLVKDLPDLDELTKGMDLSLLSKPGGFARLKQQFLERLIERSVQLRRHRHRMN